MAKLKRSLNDEPSWEELLARPKSEHKQTPSGRKVPPSVQTICLEVGAAIESGEYLTEERFHSMDAPFERSPSTEHLAKALTAFSLHQSFCQPMA